MLPSSQQDLKENTKAPGPVAWTNWALDVVSAKLATVVNVVLPYPTEEDVAAHRERLARNEAQMVDPVTGAQFAYRQY